MKKIIAVASGKGGVGKTSVSMNLALALGELGKKVCLLDADLGLANINILLGIQPELSFYDLLYNGKSLDEVLFSVSDNVKIIPGGSGIQELTSVDEETYMPVAKQFEQLEDFDYLIIDTSAGISMSNLAFSMAADMVIMVFTPEPTSLTDGFAVIKIISNNNFGGSIQTLPNMFDSISSAEKYIKKITETARKFLDIEIESLPPILRDKVVTDAVIKQKPFMQAYPSSSASEDTRKVAWQIERMDVGNGGVKPSDYLKNVVQFSSDENLSNLVNKVSKQLARRDHKSHDDEQSRRASGNASELSEKLMDQSTASVIIDLQRATIDIFEKNIQMYEKVLVTIENIGKNISNNKPLLRDENANANQGNQLSKLEKQHNKKAVTAFLDIDDYIAAVKK